METLEQKFTEVVKDKEIKYQEYTEDEIRLSDIFNDESIDDKFEIVYIDTDVEVVYEGRHYSTAIYFFKLIDKETKEETTIGIELVHRIYSEMMGIKDCYHKPKLFFIEKKEVISYTYDYKPIK